MGLYHDGHSNGNVKTNGVLLTANSQFSSENMFVAIVVYSLHCRHRRRSSVNFRRGTKILPEKYVLRISKMSEFYMILVGKIINLPEFL